MKRKILLPENIEDITLLQYQRFEALKDRDLDAVSFGKRVIEIFTDLKYRDIDKMHFADYEDIINQINKALSQKVEFKDTFHINDVEFGFIPNFDEITTAEYVDINHNGLELENMHKLMAVLFRPIKNKDVFGNYEIDEYDGTGKYADVMKYTPLNIVNGALVFFWNLSRELRNNIQKSTEEVRQRVKRQEDILKSGDGMLQS
tara:strand:- start:334 stop:942 length:609 start_codon:yes stop_codon:yes gene_type:complete